MAFRDYIYIFEILQISLVNVCPTLPYPSTPNQKIARIKPPFPKTVSGMLLAMRFFIIGTIET